MSKRSHKCASNRLPVVLESKFLKFNTSSTISAPNKRAPTVQHVHNRKQDRVEIARRLKRYR